MAGTVPQVFGRLLREYRLAASLTQEELAERSGLSARGLRYLEQSARHAHPDTVRRLADALGVTPADHDRLLAAARASQRDAAIAPELWLGPVAEDQPPLAGRVVLAPAERTSFAFVVHAAEDGAVAERVLADLAAHGIAGWADGAELRPGADLPEVLRVAMRACGAVLLVVSPATRPSRLVGLELGLAEMYGRPIVPVWSAGDDWHDCVPAELASVPYVDARGARYPEAVVALVATLGTLSAGSPMGDVPPATRTPLVPRNPYKGLRAFAEEDESDFFGRTAVVPTLVEAVAATLAPGSAAPARLLAVVGPSGSGKSSLVRAGLIPRLKGGALSGSEGWIYLDPVLPGARPVEALAVTLAGKSERSMHTLCEDLDADDARGLHLWALQLVSRPEQRVVLLVDQLEELFTLTTDEQERRRFFDLLLTAITEPRGPLLAIITLRADFYDRPLAYPAFGALLQTRGNVVLPMGVAELREIIEEPVRLPDVQLCFEPGLVGDLLYEVAGQAGALPLLEFTLEQLVGRRQGSTLTVAAYQELGGVRGALSRQAEATYAALPADEQRQLARALFLRLIDPGATEQDTTRRRAAWSELTLLDAERTGLMRAVAGAFVAARLLTASEQGGTSRLEVSHEALIREWPRLADWLREAREDIRLQQSISADAAAWTRRGCPADHLYRGSALEEALGWAARNTPSAEEQAFVEAAAQAERAQAAAERDRQARELALAREAARANRRAAARLRVLAWVLALFLLVAAGLSAVAINNASIASDARTRAVAARNAAVAELSRELSLRAGTLLDSQLQVALLLSVEADRLGSSPQTHADLLQAINHSPRLISFLTTQTSPVLSVAFSPKGTILAAGSEDGTVRLWDVARRRLLGPPLAGHADAVSSLAFTADGTILASASNDGGVRLWDVARRRLLAPPLVGQTGFAHGVAFSPNGRILASGGGAGTIQLWDVAGRRSLGPPLRGQSGLVFCLAFSPDGSMLASCSRAGTIRLWDVARRRSLGALFGGPTFAALSLAFSPDGRTLASGSQDSTIRLWDVANRRASGSALIGHTGPVYTVAFSPDGLTLASGSQDSTIRLWDVPDEQSLGPPLSGHAGPMDSLAFSPDSRTLASGGDDGAILLWNAAGVATFSRMLAGHKETVESLAFSPDGTTLASGSKDATIRLWNVARGRQVGPPLAGNAGSVLSVAFSPGGTTLASGSANPATGVATFHLWNVRSGRPLGPSLIVKAVSSAAYSPDGRILATGSSDGSVRLWDVARRRPLGPALTGHTGPVLSVAFSSDGQTLASGGADTTVRAWNVATRQSLAHPLTGHTGPVNSVAFSPDGRIVASGSNDGTIRLWDIAHWRPRGPALTGHTDAVLSVAFSPDGQMLASGSADGTIRLWDVASGQALGPALAGHIEPVASLAFSADGTTLASGSWDTTIRLWPIGRESLAQRACAIANRNLTRQEWQQYLGYLQYRMTCANVP